MRSGGPDERRRGSGRGSGRRARPQATRASTSTSSTRFMRVVTITRGSSTGVAPPARPVPLPRATNERPWRFAHCTAYATWSVDVGKHTRDRAASFDAGIASVQRELQGFRARLPGAESTFEIGDDRLSGGDPPMLPTVATRFRGVTKTSGAMREWVTFQDPKRKKHVWHVDVTFLTSHWSCIFGNGCQGVLTEPAPRARARLLLVRRPCLGSQGPAAGEQGGQAARRTTRDSTASGPRRRASGSRSRRMTTGPGSSTARASS